MIPSILKVFSTNPIKDKVSFDVERNDENSVIRISHLDSDNQISTKPGSLCSINGDAYHEIFPNCKFGNKLSNEYGNDINKDYNVLEDFYRFQERRNALLDNKKALNCSSQIQQKAAFERPNYSYTQLIYMAIESSAIKALTVNDIYTWCEHNFPYYAHAIHGWKNSLRHNLSINKCFKKITKLGVGGRGSLWVVDPRERQHLVSTMCRSNVTYFPPSIIIQHKLAPVDRISVEQPIESVQISCNNTIAVDNNDILITEKSRHEWTDTRLGSQPRESLSPDLHSISSDTDYNDWNRSISSLEPIYPVKSHWHGQCLVTPVLLPEHNYCLPDVHTVLSNPSYIVRHSFLSSNSPQLDSFSTSSDYNDEDWPRTPSPLSLHHTDPPVAVVTKKHTTHKSVKITGKKRGRPRKDGADHHVVQSPVKVGKAIDTSVSRPSRTHSRSSHIDRINNMYNLNSFFNSL